MATLADLVAPKPEPKGRTMLRDLVRGFNREAVAGVLGAPVDMANTLANLLIAGGGFAAHKAGLINQPPDLIDPARAVGSSDWIYNRLPAQPAMTGSGAETAGRLVGAIASPPAIVATAPRTLGSLVRYGMERAPKAAENYVRSLGGLTDAIVYHGSPHKFDAFDMSKIGTGEGAQAYGHGLYFAESPAVATNYRNTLSNTLEVIGDASPIEKRAGQMALTFGDNTPEGAIRWLSKFEGKGAAHTSPALTPELVASVKAKFSDGTFTRGGHLYTVDLPDSAIARMLDWDKPLSQQAPEVREAMSRADVRYGPLRGRALVLDAMSPLDGQTAYRDLTNALVDGQVRRGSTGAADRVSSEYLRQLGIPGIRYLDGASRGAGQGTYNYVVFDDKLPKILKRE